MSFGSLNFKRCFFLAVDDNQPSYTVTSKKQIQRDHPPVGATLRTQDAMSGLRSLEFEGFPPELRLRIYRLMLVDYVSVARFDDLHNDADEDQSSSETDKTGSTNGSDDSASEGEFEEGSNDEKVYAWSKRVRPQPLFDRLYDRRFPLFPAILQSNKLIHREASVVLYGENAFSWLVHGVRRTTMWHLPNSSNTFLPRHYSRLITKIRLLVDIEFSGPLGSPDDFPVVKSNLSEVSTELALNDLRFVKVDVFYPRFWLERTVTSTVLEKRKSAVQRCLTPLRMVRARGFSMEHSDAMLACGGELQAEIEGPKDGIFLSRRQQEEGDAEIRFALGDAEPDGGARGDGHRRNEVEQENGKDPETGNDAKGLKGTESKTEARQEDV